MNNGRVNPDLCGKCGKKPTAEGHDACIGELPVNIVMNACCGHGENKHAYVQFWKKPGTPIRGELALKWINAQQKQESQGNIAH